MAKSMLKKEKKVVFPPKKDYTAEENLRRLGKSKIIKDFVERTNYSWNHQDWLDLCAEIEAKGYTPVDFDQVGLMLEAKKSAYCGNC